MLGIEKLKGYFIFKNLCSFCPLETFFYSIWLRSSFIKCYFSPRTFELDNKICLFDQLFRQRFMKWTKYLTFSSKKTASLHFLPICKIVCKCLSVSPLVILATLSIPPFSQHKLTHHGLL
jgi:hypothetical protein